MLGEFCFTMIGRGSKSNVSVNGTSTPGLLLIVDSTTDFTGFLIIALVFIVHGIELFFCFLGFFCPVRKKELGECGVFPSSFVQGEKKEQQL